MFEFLARIKSITWLHRKCGGLFHGQAILCSSGINIYASSKSGMGRQRSRLQGKRETSMGTAEVEYEETQ